MVTVSGGALKKVMHLSTTDLSDTNAEYIIDQAIDELNTFGANLSNLTGSPYKQMTTTSKGRGGIIAVARMIYESYYKGLENVGVGRLTVTKPDLMSDPVLLARIEKIAQRIQVDDYTKIPFVVAEAES